MSLIKILRKHSKFVDAVFSIKEREVEINRLEATLNGESGWMQRRVKYCEKCEEICTEEEHDRT